MVNYDDIEIETTSRIHADVGEAIAESAASTILAVEEICSDAVRESIHAVIKMAVREAVLAGGAIAAGFVLNDDEDAASAAVEVRQEILQRMTIVL